MYLQLEVEDDYIQSLQATRESKQAYQETLQVHPQDESLVYLSLKNRLYVVHGGEEANMEEVWQAPHPIKNFKVLSNGRDDH